MSIACCSFGVISWDTSAVEISAEISRSSMTLTVTVFPCPAASDTARSAVRSASSLVADGSPVPALTTASLKGSGSARAVRLHLLVLDVAAAVVTAGCAVSFRQSGFQLPQFTAVQRAGQGAGDAAGVPAPDLALQLPAGAR